MKTLLVSALAAALLALMPCYAMAISQGGALTDADFVTSPRAFQNFCLAHSDQCVSHGHADLVSLNEARLAELEDVNRRVNLEIRPLSAPPPGDAYRLGVGAGSCNEYAVEKRRRLLALGWSGAALSLAVVLLPDGRGHLVLTVRTDRGDMVLDNLTGRLATADRTHYTWLERQSTIHPMLWVRIGGIAAGVAVDVSHSPLGGAARLGAPAPFARARRQVRRSRQLGNQNPSRSSVPTSAEAWRPRLVRQSRPATGSLRRPLTPPMNAALALSAALSSLTRGRA